MHGIVFAGNATTMLVFACWLDWLVLMRCGCFREHRSSLQGVGIGFGARYPVAIGLTAEATFGFASVPLPTGLPKPYTLPLYASLSTSNRSPYSAFARPLPSRLGACGTGSRCLALPRLALRRASDGRRTTQSPRHHRWMLPRLRLPNQSHAVGGQRKRHAY